MITTVYQRSAHSLYVNVSVIRFRRTQPVWEKYRFVAVGTLEPKTSKEIGQLATVHPSPPALSIRTCSLCVRTTSARATSVVTVCTPTNVPAEAHVWIKRRLSRVVENARDH